MAVTVKIPAQLRGVTEGEGEIEVEGATVGEALDAVFDAARRASRADHRGRGAAQVRERLRLGRGHPLPGRARDRAHRRRRGDDPARRRRRLNRAWTRRSELRLAGSIPYSRRPWKAGAGGDPLRRTRHPPAGAHARDPQGAGRDRRHADPLARDPDLRRPGLSPLPAAHRLPGRDDRGVRGDDADGRSRSRSSASTRGSTPPPGAGSRRARERLAGRAVLRHLRRRRGRHRPRPRSGPFTAATATSAR